MTYQNHPRIAELAKFYEKGPKVCPFMSPDVTRFVLMHQNFGKRNVRDPMLEYAKTRSPMVLAYVWEVDPPSLESEKTAAIDLFGSLLTALREDETKQLVNQKELSDELHFAFSDASQINPLLGYKGELFYAIAMSPRHASRYAPCFSVIITRGSDVASVPKDVVMRIRATSNQKYGGEYDADTLFLPPRPIIEK